LPQRRIVLLNHTSALHPLKINERSLQSSLKRVGWHWIRPATIKRFKLRRTVEQNGGAAMDRDTIKRLSTVLFSSMSARLGM